MPPTGAGLPGKVVYIGKHIAISYEPSLRDFARIAMNPVLEATCVQFTITKALPYAIAISPEDDGVYKRSFKVEPGTWTNPENGLTRVVARLINYAPHAAVVEWGGRPGGPYRKRGQAILRRVIDHLYMSATT